MKSTNLFITLTVLLAISFVSSEAQEQFMANTEMTIEQKIARFAPTEISADTAKLTSGDKKALDKIIDAARLMDPIFLRQLWSGNSEILKKLEMDSTAAGRERLHYFQINMGPWSQLDNNALFIDSAPKKNQPERTITRKA